MIVYTGRFLNILDHVLSILVLVGATWGNSGTNVGHVGVTSGDLGSRAAREAKNIEKQIRFQGFWRSRHPARSELRPGKAPTVRTLLYSYV